MVKKTNPDKIRNLLLDIIRNNKKPIILTKQLGISKQLLSYYLRTLMKKGYIRKVSTGIWSLVKDNLEDTSKRNCRGHAYIWKIKLDKIKNWDKREEILRKNNITLKKTGNTIRIIINKKKIWLNNNSIIVYEPESFISNQPVEVRKLAVFNLIETIKKLERKIGINLGNYKFSTKREHIAWLKDNLAIQCNKEGEKLKIIDQGEVWMEVDNSHNIDETEFYKTPSFSPVVNSTGYNGYYNSHKNTKWQVTPTYVLEVMNGIQQNQLIFDKNMKSHLKILNKLGKAVENLTTAVKKQNIKENLKEDQRTLFEF